MERRFRGQWVERMLRRQFRQLRWNPTGVDAVDLSTGLRYEVLSGTASNMKLHGRWWRSWTAFTSNEQGVNRCFCWEPPHGVEGISQMC